MPVTHERGYVIPAIGLEYERCAERLQDSIHKFHSNAHVTIVTTDMLPYGDQGGFANDWQCFAASPYRQTIKLEADMLCASPIDHWWTLFEKRDVVISQGARTFYDEPAESRYYRKVFDSNHLPDVYNAITYWRLSRTAAEFWQLIRTFFEQWTTVRQTLKYCDNIPANTDMIYAMVAKYMGVDRVILPDAWPTITHMKPAVNYLKTDARPWTDEFVWELVDGEFRINTVSQQDIVHYQEKAFAKTLEEYYGRLLASRC